MAPPRRSCEAWIEELTDTDLGKRDRIPRSRWQLYLKHGVCCLSVIWQETRKVFETLRPQPFFCPNPLRSTGMHHEHRRSAPNLQVPLTGFVITHFHTPTFAGLKHVHVVAIVDVYLTKAPNVRS